MKFMERLDLIERIQREEELEERAKGSAVLMNASKHRVGVRSLLKGQIH